MSGPDFASVLARAVAPLEGDAAKRAMIQRVLTILGHQEPPEAEVVDGVRRFVWNTGALAGDVTLEGGAVRTPSVAAKAPAATPCEPELPLLLQHYMTDANRDAVLAAWDRAAEAFNWIYPDRRAA